MPLFCLVQIYIDQTINWSLEHLQFAYNDVMIIRNHWKYHSTIEIVLKWWQNRNNALNKIA